MSKTAIALFLFLSLALATATSAFGASLTVNWTDNSNNEDGFKIERKLGQTGTFAEVGQVPSDVVAMQATGDIVSFVDPVPDGQLYCYRVLAFNAAGSSAWSSEACGTTLTVPLAPGGITITITITVP